MVDILVCHFLSCIFYQCPIEKIFVMDIRKNDLKFYEDSIWLSVRDGYLIQTVCFMNL